MLYLANLKFGAWHGRMSLKWTGDGKGDTEFKAVLKHIEADIGPRAKTLEVFQATARRAFKKAGFEETKP
jgi:hypothetical protein